MASSVIYSIPLIRSDGSSPTDEMESVTQGGKFIFVFTGDPAGATFDLRIDYEGHPEKVIVLGLEAPEKNMTELWLPTGTRVGMAIMGGSPTGVNVTLIFVE